MSRITASGAALPAAERRFHLEIRGLGEAETRELKSFSRETDPDLFSEELLNFGIRLEEKDKTQAAAEVYAWLSGFSESGASLQAKAARSLEALQGRGAFGPRAELLLRQFAGQATDYRMIAPMMLGSLAYGLGRNWALGRLLGATESSWWVRPASGVFGFGLETTAFTVSARWLGGGSGPWGKDLLRAGLSLGAFKLFGRLGLEASRFSEGIPGTRSLASLLPGAASFAGLLASQRLEEKFGWRPRVDDATWILDGLTATVSLGIGARLGRGLLGQRTAAFDAELNLRAELAAQTAAFGRGGGAILQESGSPALAAAGPVPGPIFMTAKPFDKLVRWVEGKFHPSEVPPGEGVKGAMKVLLRQFPHLKRVLSSSPWTLEQKWELLKAAASSEHRQALEIFRYLPGALIAMERENWTYDQQYRLVSLLGSLGEFPFPVHKYLPSALAGMKKNAWSPQDKFELIYSLAERGGEHADKIYAHLFLALGAMWESEWQYRDQYEFLHLVTRHGGPRVGAILSRMPEALGFLHENEWNFAQQSRLLSHVAQFAPDELRAAEMLADSLPSCLAMMNEMRWSTERQAQFLGHMLNHAQGQSAAAMEALPMAIDSLMKIAWHPGYARDTLESLFEIAKAESGKMMEALPALLQTMSMRGFSLPTQREILESLAARAAEVSRLSLVQFAMALVRKPLHWKRS
ncbi:MAG: hypothetical protein K8R69_09260 [Deltaproteobacteria bacterium]|nr:hypothetical protein [Deltaproteobacteria bacterium]